MRGFLASGDPRHGILLEQFERAPEVERAVTGSRMSVGPTHAAGHLMFPLDVPRIQTPWVKLRDLRSGRDLEFRLVVVRGGFLKALEGQTADGEPWPADWEVDLGAASWPAERLTLPAQAEVERQQREALARLTKWLGVDLIRLETFPPASEASVAARELGLGRFPIGYREFLRITDGIESNQIRILGHHDAYPIENRELAALLIAWDSDDRDDFVVVLSLAGEDEQVYRIDVHDRDERPVVIAASFREYLSVRLRA